MASTGLGVERPLTPWISSGYPKKGANSSGQCHCQRSPKSDANDRRNHWCAPCACSQEAQQREKEERATCDTPHHLKEIVPKISRVTVLGTSTRPGNTQALKAIELTADALGVKLQYLDVVTPKDLETSFRAAANGHAEAVLALSSPIFTSQRTKMADLAAKNRLPAIYPQQEFVQEGALMTYGVSVTDMYRRAATYVDKILKGASPADLPIEQPKKFELVINLKAAKQIGLTIPPNVLARADRVIR